MTHFWPDYTTLIAELRAEAAASEELHPDDSCIDTMRRTGQSGGGVRQCPGSSARRPLPNSSDHVIGTLGPMMRQVGIPSSSAANM